MRRRPTNERRELLFDGLTRFVDDTEAERLRLYRLHLQATVTRISPLTRDLATLATDGFEGVARGLRPSPSWPWRLVELRDDGSRHRYAHRFRDMVAHHYSEWPYSRSARAAIPTASSARDRGPAENHRFFAVGAQVEVAGMVGACPLQTCGPLASIALPEPLPETIAVAVVGRTIDALVEHPALAGRGYVVESARRPSDGGGHIITFATNVVRCRMPWAHLLEAELKRLS